MLITQLRFCIPLHTVMLLQSKINGQDFKLITTLLIVISGYDTLIYFLYNWFLDGGFVYKYIHTYLSLLSELDDGNRTGNIVFIVLCLSSLLFICNGFVNAAIKCGTDEWFDSLNEFDDSAEHSSFRVTNCWESL